MGLLAGLNKEGTTILMVTHSHHDAGFAQRIIILFDEQIVTDKEHKDLALIWCNDFI